MALAALDCATVEQLLRALPVSIFIVSPADGRVVEVNEAGARLLGVPDSRSLLGRPFADFTAPGIHGATAGEAFLAADHDGRYAESALVGLDGEHIPVERSLLDGRLGEVEVVVAIAKDLREVQLAERARRESEDRLRDFTESGSDYLWELDADLRLSYVSMSAGDTTGVPTSALLGLSREEIFEQWLHPEELADRERLEAHYETLRRREPYRDLEYRWRGDDGRYRTLRNSGKPIFDLSGRFTGYRGVGIDITERADAGRALEAERARLVQAERTAGFGHWQWDLTRGEITWSDGLFELFGLDRETVQPSADSALVHFHADDREHVRASLRNCLREHAAFAVEARFGAPGRHERQVHVTGECEVGADGRASRLFGVVQDLTALRRAESRLKQALESVPHGMALYDPDDRLVLCNSAYVERRSEAARALIAPGLAFEELMRVTLEYDRTHNWAGGLAQRMERHRDPRGPLLFQRADGAWTETSEHRTVDGSTFVFRADVTDRESLLRSLRENERRFRAIAAATPYALCVASADQGTLYYANAAFQRTFALEGDIGRYSTTEFYPVASDREARIERLAVGPRARAEEIELVRADGERFWGLLSSVAIDFDGAPAFLSSIVDISDRKENEAELARHRERLEELVAERTNALERAQLELVRSERLAAIGQLTGTVSHELRNPLGTIRATFAVVRPRLGDVDAWAEVRLARIERNIERCVLIIEDLLDFARERPLARVGTDLDPWCEVTLADIPIPAGVRLRADLGSGMSLSADPERLRQALFNVVQNACQALEERGGGQIEVRTRARYDGACISVSDDGPGIPDELRTKVFEPLFSTKTFGVGLGLPLVRQVVGQHGGSVSILDDVGSGTTVEIWLPGAAGGGA